ncbi:mitogen-activated protein kinase kinase kinase 1-like isoform X2 [Cicer arietinum]|uniref:mitogen-activated protein kinase kinase kinase 1-like isoform X2 n=1 Tax=Cicer arietinum TaxID=3827 RepID=UPI003CC6CAC9
MNHLPRIFNYRNQSRDMDSNKKKTRGKQPKLERRNAAKNFNYDAQPSSPESSTSATILYTRSLDFYDRTSFRVEGVEGELEIICRSLGLSGPDDFSIPAATWEAMKVRSSSDVLPRLNPSDFNEAKINNEVGAVASEDRVSIRDSPAETSGCCNAGNGSGEYKVFDEVSHCCTGDENRVPIRGLYETNDSYTTGGGGIKGFRPPMLKPPPGFRVSVVDNTCSTWDLLKDFAPVGEGRGKESYVELSVSNNDREEEEEAKDEEEGEVGGVRLKRVEEDNVEIIGVFSRSCSFTTSHEDDSSSTTMDTRSNSISPNVRFKPVITPGSWQKVGLLGRGSFGSVYEGMSDDGFFFAVKEVSLLDQGSQGKQSVFQLEQEIDLLSKFEHENIVRYIGTEMDDSNLYIFIEFVTKGSLLSLYRRYKLRDSQVSAYTRQILHGLKYLHDRNIVHRDIKCANILVDANGSVKVADFGLAKAIKLNDVKSCKGTAFWMAPEISALFKIGKGEPPPVPDSLSRDARDFILQCLKVNPDDRPTAAQLLDHKFVRRSFSQSSGSASPHILTRG